MPTLDELFQRRWCYFIPLDGFVPGKGFRVSIVFAATLAAEGR